MPPAGNSSLSPAADEHLRRVPLRHLVSHPANANLMDPDLLDTLTRNIARTRRYPPLVIRPHPAQAGDWQILDGHQRAEALRRLGHADALCFDWPCDDATALLLLATLNRLAGEDVPGKRATLLEELSRLVSVDELAALLPEDAAAIEETIRLTHMDAAALVADLEAAAERSEVSAPHLVSIAVEPHEEALIEAAIAKAQQTAAGRIRRGEALASVCGRYLEAADA